MSKYRKKPVVVDAEQFKGVGYYEAYDQPYPQGVCLCEDHPRVGATPHAHIHTLEGAMLVSVDDWIITGVKGERYPCKPDIFEATYEKAEG